MATITIPKKLIKEEELILIPWREYEKLLARKITKPEIKVKRSVSFHVPKKHEAFYKKLDRELTECLRDCEKGDIIGPFSSVKELKRSLEK